MIQLPPRQQQHPDVRRVISSLLHQKHFGKRFVVLLLLCIPLMRQRQPHDVPAQCTVASIYFVQLDSSLLSCRVYKAGGSQERCWLVMIIAV